MQDEYMQRALQLAALGRGSVSPNPMVGCVVVSEDRIIGEGWHRNFGGPHAEVEAINNAVENGFADKIAGSTVFVTLEPCSHHGKTPPCADMLVSLRVGRVVIANEDPNPLVSGRGIRKLQEEGIEVVTGVGAEEAATLNKRFFTGIASGRPYIILKWAQTKDGYLALPGERTRISNPAIDVMVHKWRAEEDAILVGRQTVETDNPRLNLRHWAGVNPVRVILDSELATARSTFNVFDRTQNTVFINREKEILPTGIGNRYVHRESGEFPVGYLAAGDLKTTLSGAMKKLYDAGIGSVLVEGGASVLNSFLREGLWDEIRMIQSEQYLGRGTKAPQPEGILSTYENVQDNTVSYFLKKV